ncbi:MAG: hypothetical protein JNK75_07710 [Betaproteobacteria bacterium]|nr:hypothetical protein [Betaproteobacteria bacterium]
MSSPASAGPAARSDFVTLTAWAFIGLGLLMGLLHVAQLAYLLAVVPLEHLDAVLADMAASRPWPEWMRLVVRRLPAWLATVTLLSLLCVAAGVALLQRRPWARVLFIVLMVLGVVAHVAGAVLPFVLDLSPAPLFELVPPEWRGLVTHSGESSGAQFKWTLSTTSLAFAALFGWTAWVLHSPRVRAEFVRP